LCSKTRARKPTGPPLTTTRRTHTQYPEFDPLKPLEPEEEWSFTFDKPGEWKHHDHQNPYLCESYSMEATVNSSQFAASRYIVGTTGS
jgi:hypothetical protein